MKKPLPIGFVMIDVQELCKMAGFTFQHRPEINNEYLDRLEKEYQLPACPKYQKDVDAAIRVVLAYLIWNCRDDSPEEEI